MPGLGGVFKRLAKWIVRHGAEELEKEIATRYQGQLSPPDSNTPALLKNPGLKAAGAYSITTAAQQRGFRQPEASRPIQPDDGSSSS